MKLREFLDWLLYSEKTPRERAMLQTVGAVLFVGAVSALTHSRNLIVIAWGLLAVWLVFWRPK